MVELRAVAAAGKWVLAMKRVCTLWEPHACEVEALRGGDRSRRIDLSPTGGVKRWRAMGTAV